jgi:hypothetical protein
MTDDTRTPETTERKPWRLKPHERLERLRRERNEHNAQVGRKRPDDEGDDFSTACVEYDPLERNF